MKRTKVEPLEYCKMVTPHFNEFKAKHEFFHSKDLIAFLEEKGLQLATRLPSILVKAKIIKRDNTFKKQTWVSKEPIMFGSFKNEVQTVVEQVRRNFSKSAKKRIGIGVATLDENYAIKYLKERGYKILKPRTEWDEV